MTTEEFNNQFNEELKPVFVAWNPPTREEQYVYRLKVVNKTTVESNTFGCVLGRDWADDYVRQYGKESLLNLVQHDLTRQRDKYYNIEDKIKW
jgi:hypothetical protein